ncbi:hypothetical protein [Deinococcus sp.]|uniref:hypothetical protein n=1 Tax=Deinococcus sp. TaxID=47478 RepID=UPI003CC657D0
MTIASHRTESPARSRRQPGRFQQARATLLMLLLCTGMIGYSATQVLSPSAQQGGFHFSTTQTPSQTPSSSAQPTGARP